MNKGYFSTTFNIIGLPLAVGAGINGQIDGSQGLMGTIHDNQVISILFMLFYNFVNIPYRFNKFVQCTKGLRRFVIKNLSDTKG